MRIAAVMRRPADRFVRPVAESAPAPAPAPAAAADGGVEEPAGVAYDGGWVVLGSLRVHPDDAVAFVEDRPVVLNPRAFDLLEVLLYADGGHRSAADLSIAIHDDPARAADLARVELLMRGLVDTLRGVGAGRRWIEQDEHGYRLVRD